MRRVAATSRSAGRNVEFVAALPVLMPLADEPPRGCERGQRFLVVVDWYAGETAPDDPALEACAPEPEPVWSIPEARTSSAPPERRRGSANEEDRARTYQRESRERGAVNSSPRKTAAPNATAA